MTSTHFSRRHLMAAMAGSAALSALPHRAFAQQPLPPLIKLVVGYSAGGPVDGAARLLAPALSQELGTQVIVDNRPGASGSVGGDAVAKAVPDGALLEKMTGVQLTHVPYKGSAPALADVMGGTVTMMFDIIATSRPFIQSGKIRALAVTSRQRNRMLPEVPTMIESGVAGYDVGGWFGLYGPARMDAALVARLNAAAHKALAREDVAHRLREQGYEVWSGGAELLAAKGQADRRLWATAAQGIEAE